MFSFFEYLEPETCWRFLFLRVSAKYPGDTVDGRNPAPRGMYKTL